MAQCLPCVLAALETARREVARHLAEADPDLVTSTQAAELVALFADIERLGASGKVLYAQRAAQSMVWRDAGHRSAASWMAATTGTGLGEALGALETSAALGSFPRPPRPCAGVSSRPPSSESSPTPRGRTRSEAELLPWPPPIL